MSRSSRGVVGIPSAHCVARSKRSGELCRNYARVGTLLCHKHWGATPQNVARGELKMTLAAYLQGNHRRIDTQLEDAQHSADAMHRYVRDEVVADDTDPDKYTRLAEAVERVMKLGKDLVTTGVHVKIAEAYVQAQGKVLEQMAPVMLEDLREAYAFLPPALLEFGMSRLHARWTGAPLPTLPASSAPAPALERPPDDVPSTRPTHAQRAHLARPD